MRIKYVILAIIAFGFTGCAIFKGNKKIRISKSQASASYTTLDSMELSDGNAPRKNWWICFSDQVNNSTQVSPNNDIPQKKLGFLEPLFVIGKKGDYVKVAAYNASLNLKESKGKTDKKALKIYGWVQKDKLLLWSGALKDIHTFFPIRTVTAIAGEDMFLKPEKYFSNDSLLLFSAPDLIQPLPAKIAIGQLAYIYKISADKKSYLIGTGPFATPDSIKQTIVGWVSTNAVSVWGSRAAFTYNRPSSTRDISVGSVGLFRLESDTSPVLPLKQMNLRTPFENIFPVQNISSGGSNNIRTAYLGDILDRSKNKVLNVLGKPIFYNNYQELLQNNTRLNVVFVIDGGNSNRLYLPSIESALQDLQLYFDTTSYFKTTRFGAVMYKQTKCYSDTENAVQPLSARYNDVVKFIQDSEKRPNCNDETDYRSVGNAIKKACGLLNDAKKETNIIVVVGTTGDDLKNSNVASVSSAVSRVQARLMFFQTINKSADTYNDFILAAAKTVSASAQDIGELKKEKLVNQDDVLSVPSYSLKSGDSGIYYLDYPLKSMVQGYVLYPKKGEVMSPGMLKQNFDSLLSQVIADNKRTSRSLHTYFNSNIGINNTEVLPPFQLLPGIKNPVPLAFVKATVNTDNVFFIPAYALPGSNNADSLLNYGVLLTEAEYDRQVFYFNEVFKISGAGEENFDRRKAVRKYIHFLSSYSNKLGNKKEKNEYKRQSIAETLTLFTGYVSNDSLAKNTTLTRLKKSRRITTETALHFFGSFKDAANAMIENKNAPTVKINCNGAYYYWVDKKLMPKI